jgi:hypothetical protein
VYPKASQEPSETFCSEPCSQYITSNVRPRRLPEGFVRACLRMQGYCPSLRWWFPRTRIRKLTIIWSFIGFN